MWRQIAVTCGVASALLTAPAASGAAALRAGWSGNELFAIERSIDGAARRLAGSECQRIFTDFTDPSGRTLASNLADLGKSPVEFLQMLYFMDDREAPRCQGRGTLAFTAPGQRVIRVCGRRFAANFVKGIKYTEAIVIHEMLHALGLGENPPSSRDITARVLTRCS